MALITCTGRGDSGDHCCYIAGAVCKFLDTSGSVPRCSLWVDGMGGPEWQAAPVGQWFAVAHTGYDCKDWPQNIPEAMAEGRGLCCWQGEV